MIAADVPFLRAILKMAIEDAGFEVVEEVSDSIALLDSCLKQTPDVILLDLNLPDIELIRLIEDILDIDPIMAIVTMADVIEGQSEKALAAGARAFLQKPFSMYDLVDMMRKVAPIDRYKIAS